MSAVPQTSTEIGPATPTDLSNNSPSDASTDQQVLETSSQAIIACNSISVAACLLVIVIYALLHRKYTRVMQRTSLVLSCAMATSDLLLHATSLVGYSYLPPGFACDFIGGWLYAFPSLLSVFYSCCIALNSQLYLVFRREPKDTDRGIGTLLKFYIITPIVVSGTICFTALGAGLYGYDSIFGYCWFATPPEDPDHPHQSYLRPFIGMMVTFGGWCLLALCYLLFASSTVAWVVYGKSVDVDFGGHIGLQRSQRKFSGESSVPISSACGPQWVGHALTSSTDTEMQKEYGFHSGEFEIRETASFSLADDVKFFGKRSLSDIQDKHETVLRVSDKEQAGERHRNIHRLPQTHRYASGAAQSRRIETTSSVQEEQPKISRRTLALRAMTLRLIGYILIPVVCILPSVTMDIIVKAYPVGDVEIPDAVTGFFDGVNGLVGLFNAILFLLDPVLLIIWAELRANHRWGLWKKEHKESQYVDHDNVIEINEMGAPPLQEAKPPGRSGGGRQVGGIHTTRFGKADNQPPATRVFEDSVIASAPPPKLDDEHRSPRVTKTKAGPRLFQAKGMGHRKGRESRHNAGTGLTVHVQVEIAKYSDLERVDDYLHGL